MVKEGEMRVGAVALLTLVLALPAPAAPGQSRAALKLERITPLVVSGTGFGPREPVLLTYAAADLTRRVVGVRATRTGGFRARFGVEPGRCAAFTVRAAGVRGSRAVLQVEPACATSPKGPPKRAPRIPEPPDD
jgi:hypothetical protein